jgi:predicted negative regulator of RcsB-dependent stress response
MNIKIVVLIVVALVAVQMLIVWIITSKNQEFFKDKEALGYADAVSELSAAKPLAGLILKLCYAACVIEVIFVFIVKFIH